MPHPFRNDQGYFGCTPLPLLNQSAFVKELTLELLNYERERASAASRGASSSTSASASSPSRTTEEAPFDFIKCKSQQRCRAEGCGGLTYVKCAICSKGQETGSGGAYCSSFFDKGKRSPEQKRGCLAIHAAEFHGKQRNARSNNNEPWPAP